MRSPGSASARHLDQQRRRQVGTVGIEQAHSRVPLGEQRTRGVQQASAEALDARRRVVGSVREHQARAGGQHALEQRFKACGRIGDVAAHRSLARGQADVLRDVAQKARTQRHRGLRRERRHQAGFHGTGAWRLCHHRDRAVSTGHDGLHRHDPLNQL